MTKQFENPKGVTRVRAQIVQVPAVMIKCPVKGQQMLVGDPRLAQQLQQPNAVARITCDACGQNHDLFVSTIVVPEVRPKPLGKIEVVKR